MRFNRNDVEWKIGHNTLCTLGARACAHAHACACACARVCVRARACTTCNDFYMNDNNSIASRLILSCLANIDTMILL